MKYRSLALVGVLALAVSAQAVIIDDFTQGTYSLVADAGSPRAEAVRNGIAASLAGGQRDTMLEYVSGPLTVSANLGSGGVHFFNADSQTSGLLYLQYDGADGEVETDLVQTPGTGLGLNLSTEMAFLLDFRFVNGGLASPLSVTITVTSSNGSFSHTSNIASGTLVLHSVSFANFANANFSDVQRLDFVFNAPASADFTLDLISTQPIPEPASLAVLGLGAAALIRRRRKS